MKNKQKIGILVEMLVMFATLSSVAGTMNSSNNFERGTSNFVDVEIKKNVDSYNEDELVSAERAPFSVTVTDLGAGFISQVLNDLGQVLGEFNGEAVIWSEGSIEVIETPGDNPTEAYDINNLGEVVGYYIDGYLYTAFFWDGTSHDVKKPYSEYEIDSKAFAINDVGKIVGCVLFDFFPYKWYAASWDDYLTVPQGPTLPYPWPSAEPDLYAIDVNELEDVVGYYWNYIDGYVPWYWQDESLQAQYLETGDLTDVRPTGINDNGQIIGYGTLSGYYRSCLWENYLADPEILIGIEDSNFYIKDINNTGNIVGNSDGKAAMIEDGSTVDLNDGLPFYSQWILQDAVGINDVGQIIGTGTYAGAGHGFILTFETCPYDVNDDGVVDTIDYGLVMAAFGCDPRDPANAPYDVNYDCVINTLDCGLVQAAYGPCPC